MKPAIIRVGKCISEIQQPGACAGLVPEHRHEPDLINYPLKIIHCTIFYMTS